MNANQEGALCVRNSRLLEYRSGEWEDYQGPPMVIAPEKYQALLGLITIPGPLAEVGVAAGGVVWALAKRYPDRSIYAYDTFTGLPEKMWSESEIHKPGEFAFPDAWWILKTLPNVTVRPGQYPETAGNDPIDKPGVRGFAAVHLDCDFYLSTYLALDTLRTRMAPGGVIVLDDWDWPACPGVRRAVEDQGMEAHPTGVPNQAVIRFPV